ncbi:DUF2927 domain-containing protein [Thalassotalea fusca]
MRALKIACITLALTVSACSTLPISTQSSPKETELTLQSELVMSYFEEIAFGSEFGSSNSNLRKWQTDVKIFVAGETPDYLSLELTRIIEELNDLIQEITIYRVETMEQANYVLYLGDAKGYELIEPYAKSKTKDNWGLFWVYWNNQNAIYKASMYVDTHRTKNKRAQKHLLREELTQSLGLMNDSYRYKDSIFFQKWSFTTEFSSIDKRLIRLLYHPDVKIGMDKSEFRQIVQSQISASLPN